jgi:hypothetical protein
LAPLSIECDLLLHKPVEHGLVTAALGFAHRSPQLATATLAISLLQGLERPLNSIGETLPSLGCRRYLRGHVKGRGEQCS